MPDIHTLKAQPLLRGADPVPDLHIHFDRETEGYSTLEEQSAAHQREAEAMLKAMVQHMPGGLLDALLGQLLAYRASHFVVSFEDKGSKP